MNIFGFFGGLLGYVLWGAFWLIQNFGLSIIVFTIIIKLILLPFSIKQQRSMAGNARLSKKQKEIREKYGNNRAKMQEEMDKLYKKEGVKPMGGCLTTLIPMLIILGIFYAVAYPLTNTLHINSQSVAEAIQTVNTIPGYAMNANPTYQEISLLKFMSEIGNPDILNSLFGQSFTSAEINQILTFAGGFNTFGVDLLAIPNEFGLFSWYILFPVCCFLSNIGSQFVMTKINKNVMQQPGCMKVMMLVLPLFSAFIAYSVPAAVAFYWIISAIIGLIQSVILGKLYSPARITANTEARHTALMFENEAKVPYVYAPKTTAVTANATANKTAKKKKK